MLECVSLKKYFLVKKLIFKLFIYLFVCLFNKDKMRTTICAINNKLYLYTIKTDNKIDNLENALVDIFQGYKYRLLMKEINIKENKINDFFCSEQRCGLINSIVYGKKFGMITNKYLYLGNYKYEIPSSIFDNYETQFVYSNNKFYVFNHNEFYVLNEETKKIEKSSSPKDTVTFKNMNNLSVCYYNGKVIKLIKGFILYAIKLNHQLLVISKINKKNKQIFLHVYDIFFHQKKMNLLLIG